jgi:hypothetical protein
MSDLCLNLSFVACLQQNTTGFCCRHAIPLTESFAWWREFESFVHYDATIITMKEQLRQQELATVAMDTCCK